MPACPYALYPQQYKRPADKNWMNNPGTFKLPDWATPEGFDAWLAREDYPALVEKHRDSIDAIKTYIADGTLGLAAEAWVELDHKVQEALWRAPTNGGCFTTKERAVIHSDEFTRHIKEKTA